MNISLFVRKSVRKALKPVYIRLVDNLVACDLHEFEPPERTVSFGCRAITEEDLEFLSRFLGEEKAASFQSRLNDSMGYVAYKNAEVLGWAWASEKPRENEGYFPLSYDIRPLPDHVYLYDGFVRSEWRGCGVSTVLTGHVLHTWREKGYHRAFMTMDVRNRAIHRVASHCGFHTIGQLVGWRLLGKHGKDISALRQVAHID